MISVKKKILAGVLVGTFLFSVSASIPTALAAPENDQAAAQKNAMSAADMENMAKEIADQYGVNQAEVKKAISEGIFFDDIYYAAMLAKVSGKSFSTVISMKADWFDVMKKLGITREHWDAVLKDMMAEDIAARSNLTKDTVKKLMEERYNPRDIRIAGRLANASKKDVRAVLNMKKLNMRWRDVAGELKVDQKVLRPRNEAEAQEDAEAEGNANGENAEVKG